MIVKKAGGKVIGANLTAAEKKALDIEIKKELVNFNRQNWIEIDALFVWWVRRRLHFGEKRLKKFYFEFHEEFRKLIERYELGSEDGPWLCTEQLKEEGFDLEAWHDEAEKLLKSNEK